MNLECDYSFILTQRAASEWMRVTPWSMRLGLNWVRTHYDNVPVIITENGLSDSSGATNDTWRVNFYRAYIDEVLKGIVFFCCFYQFWSAASAATTTTIISSDSTDATAAATSANSNTIENI